MLTQRCPLPQRFGILHSFTSVKDLLIGCKRLLSISRYNDYQSALNQSQGPSRGLMFVCFIDKKKLSYNHIANNRN